MRRPLAVATLAILVLLGYGGVAGAALGAGLVPPVAGFGHDAELPWIHVAHPPGEVPFLAGESGRRVVLRGVVAAGLVDYWTGTDPAALTPPPHFTIDPAAYADGACPANDTTTWIPPLCEDDFAQMRALGLDVVRVALSWSLLEPAPGRYSEAYLARVHQVVGWARASGLRVILDLHQNAYSRYLGRTSPPPIPGGVAPGLNDYDGAPAWATFTDGLPSEKFLGQREVNPAVFEAATSFWLNRAGIQDRYIAALAELARGFLNESAVLGYGVYNEPWPGWVPPPAFEDLLLFPFYRRVVDALTGLHDGVRCPAGLPHAATCGAPDLGVHDLRHLLFFDDGLLREVTDFPTHLPLPFTSYANVVLALHAYTHIYTVDRLLGIQHSAWPAYTQSYDWGARGASGAPSGSGSRTAATAAPGACSRASTRTAPTPAARTTAAAQSSTAHRTARFGSAARAPWPPTSQHRRDVPSRSPGISLMDFLYNFCIRSFQTPPIPGEHQQQGVCT